VKKKRTQTPQNLDLNAYEEKKEEANWWGGEPLWWSVEGFGGGEGSCSLDMIRVLGFHSTAPSFEGLVSPKVRGKTTIGIPSSKKEGEIGERKEMYALYIHHRGILDISVCRK